MRLRGLQLGEQLPDLRPLGVAPAEDGVDEVRLTREAEALRDLHGLVTGGVRRDAVEEEELVKSEPEEDLHLRLLHAAFGLARDEPVQRALPAHAAIDHLLCEPAVVRTHLRRGEGVVENVFDEGIALQAAEQHSRGDFAGGRERRSFRERRGLRGKLIGLRALRADDAVLQVGSGALGRAPVAIARTPVFVGS